MLNTKKLLNFNSVPVFIKHGGDSIDMIDNNFTHYRFDNKTYEVQKKTVILKNKSTHEYTNIFDISNDYLHVYPKKETKSLLIVRNSSRLKVISKLNLSEAASIVKFSNNSKHLIIGSEDGAIWLYDVALKKIIYTLPPKSDEISSIIFTKDDKLVAIASYNKRVEIYDTINWSLVCTLEVGSVTEDMVFSDDNLNLYCVQRDGHILAFELDNQILLYKKDLGQNWLSVIETYKSQNYAMVGARNNSFLIVDLKTGKTIKSLLLQNQGLSSVNFSDHSLLMTFASGSILVCDMLKNRDEALVALKVEDYAKAKQLIEENILLYLDGTIDALHECGDKVLKKIVTLIELGKIDEASKLSIPFLDDERFNEKFSAYMSQKGEIAQFIRAIEDKNFATAYRLANEYKYIKDLKKYQELEEFWYKCFNEAKNLIGKNPNDSTAKMEARVKLKAFLTISSKSISIKNLLENSIIFFQADTLVKEKKFAQFFALCETHEFLKDTKIYNKVISISQILLSNVNKAVQQKDYNNALLTARRLLSFTPVKNEITKQIKEIKIVEKFNIATENRDLHSIFTLIDENSFLENLLEYKSLMNDFEKLNEEAKEHAISGDIQQTFDTIDDYIRLNYLKDRIAFTVKLAYLNSIPLIAEERTIDWQKTFTNYIELYGKDEKLKQIAIENSVLNIYDLIQYSDDGLGYRNRLFKDKIVVLADVM